MLKVLNFLGINHLDRPCEGVSSAPHHGQTHVLQHIVDMLRPSKRERQISIGAEMKRHNLRPERHIACVVGMECRWDFRIASLQPCRLAFCGCKGSFRCLRDTHLITEEIRRDPMGGHFYHVSSVCRHLRKKVSAVCADDIKQLSTYAVTVHSEVPVCDVLRRHDSPDQ